TVSETLRPVRTEVQELPSDLFEVNGGGGDEPFGFSPRPPIIPAQQAPHPFQKIEEIPADLFGDGAEGGDVTRYGGADPFGYGSAKNEVGGWEGQSISATLGQGPRTVSPAPQMYPTAHAEKPRALPEGTLGSPPLDGFGASLPQSRGATTDPFGAPPPHSVGFDAPSQDWAFKGFGAEPDPPKNPPPPSPGPPKPFPIPQPTPTKDFGLPRDDPPSFASSSPAPGFGGFGGHGDPVVLDVNKDAGSKHGNTSRLQHLPLTPPSPPLLQLGLEEKRGVSTTLAPPQSPPPPPHQLDLEKKGRVLTNTGGQASHVAQRAPPQVTPAPPAPAPASGMLRAPPMSMFEHPNGGKRFGARSPEPWVASAESFFGGGGEGSAGGAFDPPPPSSIGRPEESAPFISRPPSSLKNTTSGCPEASPPASERRDGNWGEGFLAGAGTDAWTGAGAGVRAGAVGIMDRSQPSGGGGLFPGCLGGSEAEPSVSSRLPDTGGTGDAEKGATSEGSSCCGGQVTPPSRLAARGSESEGKGERKACTNDFLGTPPVGMPTPVPGGADADGGVGGDYVGGDQAAADRLGLGVFGAPPLDASGLFFSPPLLEGLDGAGDSTSVRPSLEVPPVVPPGGGGLFGAGPGAESGSGLPRVGGEESPGLVTAVLTVPAAASAEGTENPNPSMGEGQEARLEAKAKDYSRGEPGGGMGYLGAVVWEKGAGTQESGEREEELADTDPAAGHDEELQARLDPVSRVEEQEEEEEEEGEKEEDLSGRPSPLQELSFSGSFAGPSPAALMGEPTPLGDVFAGSPPRVATATDSCAPNGPSPLTPTTSGSSPETPKTTTDDHDTGDQYSDGGKNKPQAPARDLVPPQTENKEEEARPLRLVPPPPANGGAGRLGPHPEGTLAVALEPMGPEAQELRSTVALERRDPVALEPRDLIALESRGPGALGADALESTGSGVLEPMGPGALDSTGPGAMESTGPGALKSRGPGALESRSSGALEPRGYLRSDPFAAERNEADSTEHTPSDGAPSLPNPDLDPGPVTGGKKKRDGSEVVNGTGVGEGGGAGR
ncbi:unnamed protein product, partial [Discosporangium mesarthrocarpum]